MPSHDEPRGLSAVRLLVHEGEQRGDPVIKALNPVQDIARIDVDDLNPPPRMPRRRPWGDDRQ
jgi:hypothetical protein